MTIVYQYSMSFNNSMEMILEIKKHKFKICHEEILRKKKSNQMIKSKTSPNARTKITIEILMLMQYINAYMCIPT